MQKIRKFIKLYIEIVLTRAITENGPRPIIRTAALSKIISEDEARRLMEMVIERNKASHMYREEIADEIAKHPPKAYKLIFSILERLHQNVLVKGCEYYTNTRIYSRSL